MVADSRCNLGCNTFSLSMFFTLFLSAVLVQPTLSNCLTDGNCTTSLVVVLLSQKYEGGQESTVNVLTEWSTTLEDSKNLLTFSSFIVSHKHYSDEEIKLIAPVLSNIYNQFGSKAEWFLIIKPSTILSSLSDLIYLLSQYKEPQKRSYFLGRGLQDDRVKIIHHFIQPGLMYPMECSGFVLSNKAMNSIYKNIDSFTPTFTIDPLFEFSLFLKYMRYPSSNELHPSPPPKHRYGIVLTHVEEFCGGPSYRGNNCVTLCSVKNEFCSFSINYSSVFFAVKTCQKYHKKRIPYQLKTWATPTSSLRLQYYSDVTDDMYGTLSVGVANTERGHCTKLMEIFKLVLQVKGGEFEWVVVADDDTLLCTSRLMSYLSCHDSSSLLVIGEVYGYNLWRGGYLYPTAGSGVLLTKSAVQKIVASGITCPSHDYPDDMFLGTLIRTLKIPLLHTPLLHQDQPQSYHKEHLSLHQQLSFHRFSPSNPIDIYLQYLTEKERGNTDDGTSNIRTGNNNRVEL